MKSLLTFQVAVCSSGPVTCVTTPVEANMLQGRHIFGQQQAVFPDVPLQLDLVVVVRVYLDDGRSDRADGSTPRDAGVDDGRSIASYNGTLKSQRIDGMSSRNSMEAKAGVPEDSLTLVAWGFVPLAVHGMNEI